jgi:hypothetical protein
MKFIKLCRCEKFKNFCDETRLCSTPKDLKSGVKENSCVQKMRASRRAILKRTQSKNRQILTRRLKILERCKLMSDGKSMCSSLKTKSKCKSNNYKSWLKSVGQRRERKRERVVVAKRKRSDDRQKCPN